MGEGVEEVPICKHRVQQIPGEVKEEAQLCEDGRGWPCSLAPSLGYSQLKGSYHHPWVGAAYGSVHPLRRSLTLYTLYSILLENIAE